MPDRQSQIEKVGTIQSLGNKLTLNVVWYCRSLLPIQDIASLQTMQHRCGYSKVSHFAAYVLLSYCKINEFVGISLVDGSMVSYIRLQLYIWSVRTIELHCDIMKTYCFFDVRASFSRTIFKPWD